jgi:hypothetical protein
MPDQIAFRAQIKLISVKSLQSLDTEGELRLRFFPADAVLEVLHRLHKGDANVMVVVMPDTNDSEINNREKTDGQEAVPTRRQRKPKG